MSPLPIFIEAEDLNQDQDLPDISVKDTATRENHPVAFVSGWDDDKIQAQTLCYSPMEFLPALDGVSASQDSEKYWVKRLSKVLARFLFSTSGANCVFRPFWIDKNDITTYGDAVTVTAISAQDGSLYHAPMESFNTLGAKAAGIRLESVSSGAVSVWLAGV